MDISTAFYISVSAIIAAPIVCIISLYIDKHDITLIGLSVAWGLYALGVTSTFVTGFIWLITTLNKISSHV